MKCTGIIVSTLRPPCGFLYALHPSTNQTSCACACLPVVAANGWPTTPKLSRLAINSTATSLALIAPSGVPPPDGVDMVEIVVCALVRMIELVEKPSEMGPLKKHSKKRHGNTYVPALTSSESLACFLVSIMYNPVPKTACSVSSQMYPPSSTADDHMVGFGLLCTGFGPKMGSA